MKNGDTASHAGMPRLLNAKATVGVLLVSLVYFADILLRSSRKLFWFDELYTVYLCRLPDLRSTLTAVRNGADFNPPLFYFFARSATAVFGEGPIASRVPEMLGVWVFGFSLFLFVSRRLGRLSGFIAGVFPFFTLAQYYAYEDRPHGITLAWCGLALLSWQRIVEGSSRPLYSFIFTASLLGGILTHVYAVYLFVPFALFEAYSLLRYRKIHWIVPVGALVCAAVAIPVYLPLVRSFKHIEPGGSLPPSILFAALLNFTQAILGSSVYILLLLLAFGAYAVVMRKREEMDRNQAATVGFSHSEVVLAICFAVMPVFGITGTMLSHAPFFHRYFLSCLAGVAILLAYASFLLTRFDLQQKFALCILLLMCGDLASVVMNTARGRSDLLVEPSSRILIAVPHDGSLDSKMDLFKLDRDIPVVELDGLKYIYLFYYAPPAFTSHLYYGAATEEDLTLRSYRRMAETTHVTFKATLLDTFFQSHDHFYVLNNPTSACGTCLEEFVSHGFILLNVKATPQGDLYEYQRQAAGGRTESTAMAQNP